MPTTITNVTDAKANLSKLLEQVERGKEIIIGRNGKPIAVLTAFKTDSEPRRPGMGKWKGKIKIAKDFDDLPDELLSAFHGSNE